jgi:isoamyl acetate esterase
MKSIRYFAFLLLLFAMSSFIVQNKKKVIFFGDSITQAGVQPGGYILKIGDLAAGEGARERFDLIGAGIGGNKVYDLYLRLEDDVLNKKPDIVFIYVGVNDVWHRQSHGTGTDLDKFEKFYQALIRKIQGQGAKVVLVTPAVIGEKTDLSNGLDTELNDFSVVIRTLAKNNNLPLVDLRKAFLDYNRRYNPSNRESGILTTDRVHLNEAGNNLVAEEMWKVLKTL